MQTEYQPRYVAYAATNGRAPADQIAHDGGMAQFMAFISREMAAFKKAHPKLMFGDAIADHDAFTTFIRARARKSAVA